VLKGHTAAVTSAAFGPNGSWLATASEDKTVIVWDAKRMRREKTLRHDGRVFEVVPLPDGNSLLTASAVNPRAGRDEAMSAPIPEPLSPDDFPRGAAAHPGGYCEIRLWDIVSAEVKMTVRPELGRGHMSDPDARVLLATTVDGSQFVVLGAGAHMPDLKILDAATGEEKLSQTLQDEASALAFSPRGWPLVVGTESRRRARPEEEMPIDCWLLPNQFTPFESQALAFSPDGATLAAGDDQGRPRSSFGSVSVFSASYTAAGATTDDTDDPLRGVRLWDVENRQICGWFDWTGRGNAVRSVAFSPDGSLLATGGAVGEVLLWDVSGGQSRTNLLGHSQPVDCVAVSPDGKTIASGSPDKTVRLWDLARGTEQGRMEGQDGWTALAFSSDGKRLAAGSESGKVVICDVPFTDAQRVLYDHRLAVRFVGFSDDGGHLASYSYDGRINVWDTSTGKSKVLNGPNVEFTAATMSADSRTLITSEMGGALRMWRISDGRPFSTLDGSRPATAIAVSPDGERLAAIAFGGVLELWDVEQRRREVALEDQTENDDMIVYCPDGQTFVTASSGRHLWTRDARTGQRRCRYPAGRFVAFTPDGRSLLTGGTEGGEFGIMIVHADPKSAPDAPPDQPSDPPTVPVRAENEAVREAAWYRSRGHRYAESGQWKEAALNFARATELHPDPAQDWYLYALAQLGDGNQAGYRSVCQKILEHFQGSEHSPEAVNAGCWACVVGPGAVDHPERLVRLLEDARPSLADSPELLTTYGATLYRAARLDQAVQRLTSAIDSSAGPYADPRMPSTYACLLLAMAYDSLGNKADSETWLKKATEAAKREMSPDRSIPWNRRLTFECLQREAETMIGSSAPLED
jgi:WD40 repeat protein